MMSSGVEPPLPQEMILTLRIDRGLNEHSIETDFLRDFYGAAFSRLSAQDISDALDRAARDKRVRGVVFTLESGPFDVAQVQDVRAAIRKLRAAGKFAYVYSPSYAEAGSGMGAYYLASAFDEIWMQPIGMVDISGFDASGPFFRRLLDKWGVNPQFYQRKAYKNVMENLTRTGLSDPSREMLQSLVGNLMDQMHADISAERTVNFRALVNDGIFMDEDARKARLVDQLGSYDDMLQKARGQDKTRTVTLARYYNQTNPKKAERNLRPATVGIIYANGAIVADDRSPGFGGGGDVAAANRISDAIMRTARAQNVDAIIMRVNSPGGSPTASETIRRAVKYALDRDIPVIVSMGPMAGSGGYWIATDATRIFAMPATLTGSIGVASGKMDFSGLMQKLDVTWDGVTVGDRAQIWSPVHPFNPAEDAVMNKMMDSLYDAFITRVAEGRKMDKDVVDKIAGGRVWTGAQAVEIGLVDQLGSLGDAMDYVATTLGHESRHDLNVVRLPRPRTPFDRILKMLDLEVMMDRVATALIQRFEKASQPRLSLYDPALDVGF
jgi:protease-4